MKFILKELTNNIDLGYTLGRAKRLEEGQSFVINTMIGKIEIGKVKTKNGLGKTFYIKQISNTNPAELEYMRQSRTQTTIDNLSSSDIKGIEYQLKMVAELERRIKDARK